MVKNSDKKTKNSKTVLTEYQKIPNWCKKVLKKNFDNLVSDAPQISNNHQATTDNPIPIQQTSYFTTKSHYIHIWVLKHFYTNLVFFGIDNIFNEKNRTGNGKNKKW